MLKYKPLKEQAVKMFQEGWMKIDIAIELGVSKHTIYKWLKDFKSDLSQSNHRVAKNRWSNKQKKKPKKDIIQEYNKKLQQIWRWKMKVTDFKEGGKYRMLHWADRNYYITFRNDVAEDENGDTFALSSLYALTADVWEEVKETNDNKDTMQLLDEAIESLEKIKDMLSEKEVSYEIC